MTINISQHYQKHKKNINNNQFIYKVKKAFYLLTNQEERLYEVGFSEGFLYAADLLQKNQPIVDSNLKRKIGVKYKSANMETVNKVIDKVCKICLVSKHDIFSKSRTRDVVRARSILYNLLHESYDVSISSMSRVFNQDHTTIIHSLRNKEDKRNYWGAENSIWEEFKELQQQL
jgi:chromosomal replication initiation ATPase DnaA|tara:strand:+ start:395 stop:916 length:522 start_codon:yes stop_codon:yes gene_type:complete